MEEVNNITDISNKTYKIEIDIGLGRGWFEHKRLSTTGTLMFEGRSLIDFDGVDYLPLDVIHQLERSGFDVEGFN